jgi:hypothetical protein
MGVGPMCEACGCLLARWGARLLRGLSGHIRQRFLHEFGKLVEGEAEGEAELGNGDDLRHRTLFRRELARGGRLRRGRLSGRGRGRGGRAIAGPGCLLRGTRRLIRTLLLDGGHGRVPTGHLQLRIEAEARFLRLGEFGGGVIRLREDERHDLGDVRALALHASVDVLLGLIAGELLLLGELLIRIGERRLDDDAALVAVVAEFGLVCAGLLNQALELALHLLRQVNVLVRGRGELGGRGDGRGLDGGRGGAGSRGRAHVMCVFV